MTSITLSEYEKKFEIMQLAEGNCPRTKARELPYITKVHCSVNNMKKLGSIMGYMNETRFERMYMRIAHLIRILV
jgi:hypothetical protein